MKHVISINDLTEYNTRTILASTTGKKENIIVSINNDGTVENIFEVEVENQDCIYFGYLNKAIEEYNKY